jgi:beta-lactamase regulating signal transducer with metallopeptidase domain
MLIKKAIKKHYDKKYQELEGYLTTLEDDSASDTDKEAAQEKIASFLKYNNIGNILLIVFIILAISGMFLILWVFK